MNEDSRVLGRKGARELTPTEVEYTTGGVIPHTNSACTLGVQAFDGDIGECHI